MLYLSFVHEQGIQLNPHLSNLAMITTLQFPSRISTSPASLDHPDESFQVAGLSTKAQILLHTQMIDNAGYAIMYTRSMPIVGGLPSKATTQPACSIHA